jgi:hypothetical protein
MLRVATMALFILCFQGNACVAQLSLWQYNDSTIFLDVFRSHRSFYYETPSKQLIAAGVRHGDRFFEGQRNGNIYEGTIFIDTRCDGSHDVRGLAASDDRTITFDRVQPLPDQTCNAPIVLKFRSLSLSSEAPTNLCLLEGVFVPCVKLEGLQQDWRYAYKMAKFVPLWPNHALFRARGPGNGASPDLAKADESAGAHIRLFDPSRLTIQTVPLNGDAFGPQFIDKHLSQFDSFEVFDDVHFARLMPISEVYRGSEIFGYWTDALQKGLICTSKATQSDWFQRAGKDHPMATACAFAQTGIDEGKQAVKYCVFEQEAGSGIRSQVFCTTVATTDSAGTRSVLSARYFTYDHHGGGGELTYYCEVPGKDLDGAMAIAKLSMIGYLGASSKFALLHSSKLDIRLFQAEGLNIHDEKENIFLRAVLRGTVEQNANRTFVVAIFSNFTRSAQSSDNIIDYREPNQAEGDRIVHNFWNDIEKRVKLAVPQAHCYDYQE